MTEIILGLDQGTSSTRCVAFDRDLSVLGTGTVAVGASFPGPGLVEQDPAELLSSSSTAIDAALESAGASAAEVIGLGIANQTETFIVCERESGRPVYPAIVWQDRRTAERCAALAAAGHAESVRERTGLELDATFPATKVSWLLDHVDGARTAAEAGELVYHDVAGWLVAHLTAVHACEASNADRTLLCSLGGSDWDDQLLDTFEVPRALMPPIVDSDAISEPARSSAAIRVTGVLGDQQASLLGLGCVRPGMAKITLGTGAFVMAQAGTEAPAPPAGVLASCAWRRRGETSYALEGFIPTAGAALDWFAGIGVLPAASELDALLRAAGPEDGSIACVPALQGLGTPDWNASVSGALLGLTRATTRAQFARAVVDGVLHQVADALAAINVSMPLKMVLLDGGMSRSDWVVQRLADLADIRVQRSAQSGATAVGAAVIAGLSTGFWSSLEELPEMAVDRVAQPQLAPDQRAELRARWAASVELAAQWHR